MRILFDQGTPVPLRNELHGHAVATAYEAGWAKLRNGDLIRRAAEQYDLLITTDKNIRYQQNLAGRRIAILVLPTTSWPKIREHVEQVREAVAVIEPSGFTELQF